jgi:cell division GTPase FtsZ
MVYHKDILKKETIGLGGCAVSVAVAEIAEGLRLWSAAVVTAPFFWEGKRRALNAEGNRKVKKIGGQSVCVPQR